MNALPVAMAALCMVMTPADDRDRDGISDSRLEPDPPSDLRTLPVSGTFLYDRSHGGFIAMADFGSYLIGEGWTFRERSTGTLSAEVLQDVDILFFPGSLLTPFMPEELEAITRFLQGGGGLWMVNDYFGSDAVLNQVSVPLGVTFHGWPIQGTALWPDVRDIRSHFVTSGVSSYKFYQGCCLEVRPPGFLLGRLASGYSFSCPDTPGVLAAWEDRGGRAIFQSDATPLHSSYFPEKLPAEHLQLLDNIVLWLMGPRALSVDESSWGSIKAAYQGAERK